MNAPTYVPRHLDAVRLRLVGPGGPLDLDALTSGTADARAYHLAGTVVAHRITGGVVVRCVDGTTRTVHVEDLEPVRRPAA